MKVALFFLLLFQFSYFCPLKQRCYMEKYVDVILPLPLWSLFTYALPATWGDEVQVGCRVVVSFGKKKYYTAIVQRIHTDKPQGYEVKAVTELLDASPILLPSQFRFWQWLADYNLCTLGDVYKAALPSGLKIESETIVVPNEEFEEWESLSTREEQVMHLLQDGEEQSVTLIEKATGQKNLLNVIKSLLEKEAITIKEELKRSYRPKVETRVRLAPDARNEHRLHIFFDELQRRAPKQLDLLMKYLDLSGGLIPGEVREVSKQELLSRSGAGAAVFNGLVQRGVLETYKEEVGRLERIEAPQQITLHPLADAQQRAYHAIQQSFTTHSVCLLHGVTAAGKTEIYMHLIEEQLRQGRQVLYLLPEIALTTQITQRLRQVFGSRLGVYHS